MDVKANVDSVIWQVVDGQAVLVQVDSSEYFGLNRAGSLLWERLASGPCSEEHLTEVLSAACGSSDGRAEQVHDFVESLAEAGLAREVEGTGAAEHPPAAGEVELLDGAVEAPAVSKFGELETLVLSGE